MKKWRFAVILALSLVMTTVTFSSMKMTTYAYTEEEKQMVKDWLSAHGYPPTMEGAEQAYRDYLNGMWGGPGGEEEVEVPEIPETMPEGVDVQAVLDSLQPVESTEEVVTTVEETTETEVETTTEEVTTEEVSKTETVSTEEMVTETETMTVTMEETETESEQEAIVTVNRYDGIIVVIAIAACAAMIGGTVYYIKKSKKDGV